ncbi:flagellar export chaperone FlgN [Candidatus Berkiella aquae]|uniref:Flagellar protein FlgN n=1 Tax=Candidatus Berkiella aquae TaxID=295108 RepID=A0A0Q9YLD6_9GAMM|nr:flagellar protein FlgN [Candidatus Berkiella aquae]MCS5711450.1 flagellar protein FlgN [Candidatus Berkiella aquae]
MIELNSSFLNNFECVLLTLQAKLASFQQFLDEEKLLLNKQDMPALEAAVYQKQTHMNEVQMSMNELKECLNSQSFEEKNIKAIIDLYPPHKQKIIHNLWNDIKIALEQCDQKNLLNGMLITTIKNLNDVILRIMTQRPQESTTYSNPQQNNQNGPISTREHKA